MYIKMFHQVLLGRGPLQLIKLKCLFFLSKKCIFFYHII